VPLFLFSVLFGLSMDYQVFLLSRIRERYDSSEDTTDAVLHGVASTARIITGAALIIVAVFIGFGWIAYDKQSTTDYLNDLQRNPFTVTDKGAGFIAVHCRCQD
jgi:uncharacterized membrane protein YdfJ with MMPL/SSD domain